MVLEQWQGSLSDYLSMRGVPKTCKLLKYSFTYGGISEMIYIAIKDYVSSIYTKMFLKICQIGVKIMWF